MAIPVFYSKTDLLSIPVAQRDPNGIYYLRTSDGFREYRVADTPTRDFIPMEIEGVTAEKISDWDEAYGWGNHAGLYAPASHVGAAEGAHPLATSSKPGFMSADEKNKLEGIQAGAQVNVKPDWNADPSSPAGILNKPGTPNLQVVMGVGNETNQTFRYANSGVLAKKVHNHSLQQVLIAKSAAEYVSSSVPGNGVILLKKASNFSMLHTLDIKITNGTSPTYFERNAIVFVSLQFNQQTDGKPQNWFNVAHISGTNSDLVEKIKDNIRVGMDASNVLTVAIGDETTHWYGGLQVSIERYSQTNISPGYDVPWTISFSSTMPALTSVLQIPTDVVVTRGWLNSFVPHALYTASDSFASLIKKQTNTPWVVQHDPGGFTTHSGTTSGMVIFKRKTSWSVIHELEFSLAVGNGTSPKNSTYTSTSRILLRFFKLGNTIATHTMSALVIGDDSAIVDHLCTPGNIRVGLDSDSNIHVVFGHPGTTWLANMSLTCVRASTHHTYALDAINGDEWDVFNTATLPTFISIQSVTTQRLATRDYVDSTSSSATNLGITGTTEDRTITSSTGTGATIPVATPAASGVMSAAQAGKLAGIEAGAQKNVATNLGITGTTAARTITSSTGTNAEIPVATTAVSGVMSPTHVTKLDGIESGAQKNVKSDWNAVTGDAQILNKPSLAAVATSGNYSDLSGRPTLATVATSGSYADLSGKPALAAVATSGSYSDLSGRPSLAPVATSGDYNDLSNKPSIPAAQDLSDVLTQGNEAPGQSMKIGGFAAGIRSVASNASVDPADFTVVADATASNISLTLPDVPAGVKTGQIFVVKPIATNNTVTVQAAGGVQIDGSSTLVLGSTSDPTWFQFDGANYVIIGA